MAVGLAQHERDTQRERRQADRPGDVAAAPQHRVGTQLAQDRAGTR